MSRFDTFNIFVTSSFNLSYSLYWLLLLIHSNRRFVCFNWGMDPDSQVSTILYFLTGATMVLLGAYAVLSGQGGPWIAGGRPGELVMNLVGILVGSAGLLVMWASVTRPPE